MNSLTMVGLTHRAAPLSLLERVTLGRDRRARLLAALRDAGCDEAVVLSTCSRTEIYAVAEADAARRLLALLAEHAECTVSRLSPAAEVRTGLDLVEHLFRVAGGLDSRVLGEVEILGQVRTAFREAHAADMTGPSLGRLFPAALVTGRRVRVETTLGAQGRSLASRAVEVGLATLSAVAVPVIVVIGSGRMAAVAVEHLSRLGQRPQVAARDEVHAARLAGPGQVCPLPALTTGLEKADLVICATSAAHSLVTLAQVRQAMNSRQSRPLTVVDLSVPRNVDLAVGSLAAVRLIDLEGMNDDWTADPALAQARREGAAIVRSDVMRYADAVAAASAGPFIAALRDHVEQTCLRELAKIANSQTLGQQDLARAAHSVAGKLLHRPTIAARRAAASGDDRALSALGELFGIRTPGLDRA